MKKITLLVLLSFSLSGFSQGVAIYIAGTTADISGTTHSALCTGDVTVVDFEVENFFGVDTIINILRKVITPLTGTEDKMCCGALGCLDGACYDYLLMAGVPEFVSINDCPMLAGNFGTINAYHRGNGNAGVVVYRYIVVNEFNFPIDSVDLELTSFASADDLSNADLNIVSNYSEQTLRFDGVDDFHTVCLHDLSGRIIWSAPLTNSSESFSSMALPEGLYVCRFVGDSGEDVKKFVWK